MQTLPIFSFSPILKSTAWGGERIAPFKGIPSAPAQVGESWEISSVAGSVSTVSGGPYDGETLTSLLRAFGPRLVGKSVYRRHGDTFPLLIKFIDAAHDLSVQVHPDDATARRLLHSPNGKTEMWFILDCPPEARIVYGFNRPVDPALLRRHCEEGTLLELLAHQSVSAGDCIFIPAGRVHAICSGTFLIEVQQTSDATFRLFDYNRLGADGRPRTLHIDQAIASIDYPSATLSGKTTHTIPCEGISRMLSCPYFSCSRCHLSAPLSLDFSGSDSFHIIINYRAPLSLALSGRAPVTVATGRTVLLPAEAATVTAAPLTGEPCEFIEVHIDRLP